MFLALICFALGSLYLSAMEPEEVTKKNSVPSLQMVAAKCADSHSPRLEALDTEKRSRLARYVYPYNNDIKQNIEFSLPEGLHDIKYFSPQTLLFTGCDLRDDNHRRAYTYNLITKEKEYLTLKHFHEIATGKNSGDIVVHDDNNFYFYNIFNQVSQELKVKEERTFVTPEVLVGANKILIAYYKGCSYEESPEPIELYFASGSSGALNVEKIFHESKNNDKHQSLLGSQDAVNAYCDLYNQVAEDRFHLIRQYNQVALLDTVKKTWVATYTTDELLAKIQQVDKSDNIGATLTNILTYDDHMVAYYLDGEKNLKSLNLMTMQLKNFGKTSQFFDGNVEKTSNKDFVIAFPKLISLMHSRKMTASKPVNSQVTLGLNLANIEASRLRISPILNIDCLTTEQVNSAYTFAIQNLGEKEKLHDLIAGFVLQNEGIEIAPNGEKVVFD